MSETQTLWQRLLDRGRGWGSRLQPADHSGYAELPADRAARGLGPSVARNRSSDATGNRAKLGRPAVKGGGAVAPPFLPSPGH